MSINLDPKQRAIVRRMRLALSLLGDPERRFFIAALRDFVAPVTADLERRKADIEFRIAKEDAIELALTERLGRAPEEGEDITLFDEQRAAEILCLYPKSEGE